MSIEVIRDLDRPGGWWLLVDGSEQSFVDLDDPLHLEFEYVQMIACLLDAAWPRPDPLRALHLGAGLATVPRWVRATRPGSSQRVVERCPQVLRAATSLGGLGDVELVEADAVDLVLDPPATEPADGLDLVVCDLYAGPDTVTELFTETALHALSARLAPGGRWVANLSDAAPFSLARRVAATAAEVWRETVVLAEPAVLRGRRSGNVVLSAGDGPVDRAALARCASGGPTRLRVVLAEQLADFVGDARPVRDAADLPPSGERSGLRLLGRHDSR